MLKLSSELMNRGSIPQLVEFVNTKMICECEIETVNYGEISNLLFKFDVLHMEFGRNIHEILITLPLELAEKLYVEVSEYFQKD